MSGRKQHYIPQSLLRGFGKQGKGKAIQVTVYSRERGVFTAATDGVAAQRYFYSEPSDEVGVETLDDRITAFETPLAEIFAEFGRATPDHAVDATKAAEAVTHLCVRQAHLRDSFASAAGDLLDGTANRFLDKEWVRTEMGLDASKPNEMFRATISKFYGQFAAGLAPMGITRQIFEQWAFIKLKTDFDRIFPDLSLLLQSRFGQLQGQSGKLARDGHIQALEQSFAPDTRVQVLKRFAWTVEPGPASGFVLPDCVAMSWSAGAGYQPLVYAGRDTDAVFMPLAHDRLLVGGHREASACGFERINEAAVACSCDYFIARDRVPEFQQLIPRIGERARKLMHEAVRAALDHLNHLDQQQQATARAQ